MKLAQRLRVLAALVIIAAGSVACSSNQDAEAVDDTLAQTTTTEA